MLFAFSGWMNSNTQHKKIRIERGRHAERLVFEWYQLHRGARLLHQNWRARGGELDLILIEGDEIVFVEVRSAWQGPGIAHSQLSQQKARVVMRSVSQFLRNYRGEASRVRVDLAWVNLKSRELHRFENLEEWVGNDRRSYY